MAIKTCGDGSDVFTDINTKEIMNTSRLVSSFMGLDVQVNKAITGDNAFAHSSGIHQDGLLKSRDAYEIVHPEDVGLEDMELILTARSGRHAVKNSLSKLGFNDFTDEEFEGVFADFLKLADSKKEVYDHDLYVIVENYYEKSEKNNPSKETFSDQFYDIEDLQIISNSTFPSASVKIRRGEDVFKSSAVGSGPVDALYSAIADVTGIQVKLIEYNISSVSRGQEALGKVKIIVEHNGEKYIAKAADTDILKASALAYINAINSIIVAKIAPQPEVTIATV